MSATTHARPRRSTDRLVGVRHRTWAPWVLGALVLLGCLGLQVLLQPGAARAVTAIFMYVALAQSWNLIGGYTGYAAFGQVVFFGLAGYTTAVLMTHAHMSFWLALPISGAVAAGYGMLFGLPLLRLRGHYFAIASLGVAEGTREIVINLSDLTGGNGGIVIPTVGKDAPTQYLQNEGFYLVFLGLAAAACVIVGLVSRSKFGFALRAIHQDEDAAAAVGVNTTRTKVLAFALSGLITGVAGSTFAFQQVTLYPDRLFDVSITVLMVVMVVIGGAGTVLGPIVGGVGLQFLSEYLREHFTNYHQFLLGAVIIIAVIFLPQGVVNYVRDARRLRQFSLLDNVRRYRL
ncbi:MAG: branched-chain amino acid ABC transporter permease [Pseudonocardia sp.]|nr:branched-chain amino acid ABC transporter permease [Pseudonocardia sp.]